MITMFAIGTLHMSAFGGKADPAVFAYRDVDGEAFVEAYRAQVAHKADHAPIATEQRRPSDRNECHVGTKVGLAAGAVFCIGNFAGR
jgi:hypothetical protein